MKGLAITSRGIEGIAALEIKELIKAKSSVEDGCIVFDFGKFEDLCLLCYRCQSVDRILYLIGSFEFDDFFEEFEKFTSEIEFDEWIMENKKIRIECTRIGTHDFKSVDVEAKAAELLLSKLKGNKIRMKDFDIIFFFYVINNKCYLGIDFAGFELNKRSYKIFQHPASLRGTIAYSLVRSSGFQKKGKLLDPFSRDGMVPIEAAVFANDFPINYYSKEKFSFLRLNLGVDFEKFFESADKKIKKKKLEIYSYDHMFKFVDFSKKNAKIAGVDKQISFSRVELEWLDIRFRKESVDRIITSLPTSKNANIAKIYNEFFYQSEFVLKKHGVVAIISRLPELVKKHAEKHNFLPEKEIEVWSGGQRLLIMLFKKKDI